MVLKDLKILLGARRGTWSMFNYLANNFPKIATSNESKSSF